MNNDYTAYAADRHDSCEDESQDWAVLFSGLAC